jgi:hypothetical protein
MLTAPQLALLLAINNNEGLDRGGAVFFARKYYPSPAFQDQVARKMLSDMMRAEYVNIHRNKLSLTESGKEYLENESAYLFTLISAFWKEQ